jgi:hypothetical protein
VKVKAGFIKIQQYNFKAIGLQATNSRKGRFGD